MVEKAVIDQRVQNLAISASKLSNVSKNVAPFGYKQIDYVLKKVRTKMNVNHISNVETKKMSFESYDDNIGFGKWLALNILLQSIWSQIKQESDNVFGSQSSSNNCEQNNEIGSHHKALAFVTEEVYWTISALLNEFSQEQINNKMATMLKQRLASKSITVKAYVKCLHKIIQYFCESVTYERIQSSVLILLLDLYHNNSKGELSNLIENSSHKVIADMDIDAILKLHVLDYKKMADYSYFVLRRESERFMLQVFMQIQVPDFKAKSRDFDKINRKFAKVKKVGF